MVAQKPPKVSCAKGDTSGEKKGESLSPIHESLPEIEVDVVEPAILVEPIPRKRNIIPVNQGVVFREAVPEMPNSPSIPAEDKGKRITTEPSPRRRGGEQFPFRS